MLNPVLSTFIALTVAAGEVPTSAPEGPHVEDGRQAPAAVPGFATTPSPSPSEVSANPPTDAEGGTNWRVPAAHSAGLLLGMRLSLSLLWPEAFDPTNVRDQAEQLRRSYTQAPDFRPHASAFEWDGDPWPINVVGHGLFGSEVYTRTRQCGHAVLPSFLAATAVSTLWEYGPEALHKQPSAQDLVLTPLIGALLGEARFQLHRRLKTADDLHPSTLNTLLRVLVDPFGEAERGLLGTGC